MRGEGGGGDEVAEVAVRVSTGSCTLGTSNEVNGNERKSMHLSTPGQTKKRIHLFHRYVQ